MKTYITKELLKQKGTILIDGKVVKFNAASYEANSPVFGESLITSVVKEDSHPLHCSTIYGDNLNYAFWGDADTLCYGDADRPIEFEIL